MRSSFATFDNQRRRAHLDDAMSGEQCAYCDQPATTRDHVPPQSLFTPPLPDNLITVPACGNCNHGASDDDEVFRNELSIMAGSFGESAKAAERLQPTMRSILRNKETRTTMVHAARPVERYSIGGIYLGLGYAVPVTEDAHKRVLTRIVRGLYWHHLRTPLGANRDIKLMFVEKIRPDWQEGINSVIQKLRLLRVTVGDGDTFQYFYGKAWDDPTRSAWVLIFFKGIGEQIVLATT